VVSAAYLGDRELESFVPQLKSNNNIKNIDTLYSLMLEETTGRSRKAQKIDKNRGFPKLFWGRQVGAFCKK